MGDAETLTLTCAGARSSTMRPRWNTRTLPVDCEMTTATASVLALTKAAAMCRAPSPSGTSTLACGSN
jgi:hypothetical protein